MAGLERGVTVTRELRRTFSYFCRWTSVLDEEVILIRVDPHHVGLRLTTWHQRGEPAKFPPVQSPRELIQLHMSSDLVSSPMLALPNMLARTQLRLTK